MKTILIFGIAGFSGRALERYIASQAGDRSYRILGFDANLGAAARTGFVEYAEADLLEEGSVEGIIGRERPDFIVNLVGLFKAVEFRELFRANVELSRRMLETCRSAESPPEKILLIGSAAEYGDVRANPVSEEAEPRPVSLYGLTKEFQTGLASFYHRMYGLPVVVARTFNILGPGQSRDLAVGNFMRQVADAKDGDEIRVGNLSSSRDYIPVEDVARQYWKLLLSGKPGEVYNVASGEARTMASVLEAIIADSGKRLVVRVDPAFVKPNDIPIIYADCAKFRSLA